MNGGDQDAEGVPVDTRGANAHPRIRTALSIMKWTALAAFALVAAVIVLALGGVPSPFPDTETSHEKPYVDFVGREYRVTGNVIALAWNDFPDKAKILVVSLMPSPGVRNRFVSYRIPLQPGQMVRIISAWKSFALIEFSHYYLVSVPGAGLPEGIPIKMDSNSDGIPDPSLYQAADK